MFWKGRIRDHFLDILCLTCSPHWQQRPYTEIIKYIYSVTDSCDVKILNCANHHGDVNSLKSPNHQRALSHCKEQHKDPQTSAATQLTCLLPLTVSFMAGVKHRHMPLPHDLNTFEVAWASMFDHLLFLLPSYS